MSVQDVRVAAEELVARTTTPRGIPRTVIDPGAIARVVVMLGVGSLPRPRPQSLPKAA